MGGDRVQAQTHRDNSDMGAACVAPGVNLTGECVYVGPTERDIVTTEFVDGSSDVAHPLAQLLPRVDGMVDPAPEEEKAVRKPGRPIERLLAGTTEPDRDELSLASAQAKPCRCDRIGR